MIANELMIGDWVNWHTYYDKPHYCRMTSIDTDSYCRWSPIPLTPDILEANRFVIRRDAYYLSCGFLGNDWSRSGVEVKFYDRAVIDIECNYFKHTNRVHLIADYVHEFQHALRLCGLNELADNFKVV